MAAWNAQAMVLSVLLGGLSISAALADDDEDKTLTKGVLAGQEIMVDTYRQLEVDCKNTGYATIKITNPPKNGKVRSMRVMAFSSFSDDNDRSKCNNRRTPAVRVFYSAKKAFTGSDEFSYEVFWVDGDVWKRRVSVTVR